MERTSARVLYLSSPLTGTGQKWSLDLLYLEVANEKQPYLDQLLPCWFFFRRLEANLVDARVYGRTVAVYEAIRRVTFGRRRTPLTRIPGQDIYGPVTVGQVRSNDSDMP